MNIRSALSVLLFAGATSGAFAMLTNFEAVAAVNNALASAPAKASQAVDIQVTARTGNEVHSFSVCANTGRAVCVRQLKPYEYTQSSTVVEGPKGPVSPRWLKQEVRHLWAMLTERTPQEEKRTGYTGWDYALTVSPKGPGLFGVDYTFNESQIIDYTHIGLEALPIIDSATYSGTLVTNKDGVVVGGLTPKGANATEYTIRVVPL